MKPYLPYLPYLAADRGRRDVADAPQQHLPVPCALCPMLNVASPSIATLETGRGRLKFRVRQWPPLTIIR